MADLSVIDEKALMGASKEELVKLAKDLQKLRQRSAQVGPQTDDELHAFIKDKWNIHVPRVAIDVEYDHCAPFDMIADAFFEREQAILGIANREGSKTTNVAIIHALNARFKPGIEAISAGAIEEQSKRAYQALTMLNRRWGRDAIKSTLISKTEWTNGSTVEIKSGTVSQMNGPHSNVLHRDEIELFDRDAFNEADNITKSGFTVDGKRIHSLDILTTSRKRARGLLQEILNQIDDANKNGMKAPYKVYKWGVAETIANQSNCRSAPENQGRPDHELCECHRYQSGEMPDESPRTLDKICAGRFYRSDGWRPLSDISNKFMKNSPAMWEAQQECRKPATDDLILPDYAPEKVGVRNWDPLPEYGRIFMGIDFGGGTNSAHAANWYQYVEQPVTVQGYSGESKVVPADSYVAFDEVYITEVGANVFANMIKAHEIDWKNKIAYFEVFERYGDPANKTHRLDFKNSHGLKTIWRAQREIEPHIMLVQSAVSTQHFFVDIDRCPMLNEELQAWQWDSKTGKQIDNFVDCVAACRYMIANVDRKLQREGRHPDQRDYTINAAVPVAAKKKEPSANPDDVPLPLDVPVTNDYMTGDPYGAMPSQDEDMSAFGDRF